MACLTPKLAKRLVDTFNGCVACGTYQTCVGVSLPTHPEPLVERISKTVSFFDRIQNLAGVNGFTVKLGCAGRADH